MGKARRCGDELQPETPAFLMWQYVSNSSNAPIARDDNVSGGFTTTGGVDQSQFFIGLLANLRLESRCMTAK